MFGVMPTNTYLQNVQQERAIWGRAQERGRPREQEQPGCFSGMFCGLGSHRQSRQDPAAETATPRIPYRIHEDGTGHAELVGGPLATQSRGRNKNGQIALDRQPVGSRVEHPDGGQAYAKPLNPNPAPVNKASSGKSAANSSSERAPGTYGLPSGTHVSTFGEGGRREHGAGSSGPDGGPRLGGSSRREGSPRQGGSSARSGGSPNGRGSGNADPRSSILHHQQLHLPAGPSSSPFAVAQHRASASGTAAHQANPQQRVGKANTSPSPPPSPRTSPGPSVSPRHHRL